MNHNSFVKPGLLLLLASLPLAATLAAPKPVKKPPAKHKPASKPTPRAVVQPTPTEEPTPTPVPTPKFQTWALLVGVSKYLAPQVPSLRFPADDAAGVRDALLDPKLGNLPGDHVRLLIDNQATRANINGAVESFLKPNVKAGDHVIIFLAGHGVAKGVGTAARSYLLPTDVRGFSTPALDASAVNLQDLSNSLAQLPAAQFVQFVDACREDPTPGRGGKQNALTDVLSRSVHIVPLDAEHAASVTFFACGVGQRAFEDQAFHHGVFTYWILDGIKAAAVPQHPDGAVDMGRLATYVTSKVSDWARQASSNGDFEMEQTPEMIFTEPNTEVTSVVLMRVRRPLPQTPVAVEPSKATIISVPPGGKVSIDGQPVGAAPLEQSLAAGTHQIRIELEGYLPKEKSLQAIDGYHQQVIMQLQPQGRGLRAASDPGTPDLFGRALQAEAARHWEIAEAGYNAAIEADGKFAPAYERLADLQQREGRGRDAVNTLLLMGSHTPATPHAFSLLASAMALYALKGPGDGNIDSRRIAFGSYSTPVQPQDAAGLARRAADTAIKGDPNSTEVNRALGLSLVASDRQGANRQAALAAFGKAAFLDDKDAANHYLLGFGIRFFGQAITAPAPRQAELGRAIDSLKQALSLRPNYYEAHRELAYCYHLLGQTEPAMREYELANANRGAASDRDEVAGNSVALATLHQERAKTETGPRQQRDTAASAGHMDDARETSHNNLAKAVGVLGMVGLGTQIRDYLPPEVRNALNLPNSVVDKVQDKIKVPIRIPRFKLPF